MELNNAINHPGIRDASRFTYPLNYVENLNQFGQKLTYNSSSWSIADGNTSIDIEMHLKKAKPKVLVVMFGGAKNRPDWGKPGPFFLGRKFSKSIEANLLFISDPTFAYDLRIRLGWYLGTKENPSQSKITELINIIKKKFNIEFIVFFGGSGGGFASLYHSQYFDNSLCLIWNPQINILNYEIPSVLKETSEIAFKCAIDELDKHVTTDITPLFLQNNKKTKILYWQNISDHHVDGMLNPFLVNCNLPVFKTEYSGWLNDRLFLFLTDLSKRHEPPAKMILLKLLQKVTFSPFYLSNDEYEQIFSEICQ